MNTRGEIKTRLRRKLQMVDTSTIFDDDELNDAISDAYLWAADRHPFPKTQKAKNTYSVASQENYDCPPEFKSNSVFQLVIGNDAYRRINYEDYLLSSQDKTFIFALFGNQFFLDPVITSDGVEIIVWGLIQPDRLTDDEDKTIFSDSEESINEGVMWKAYSDLIDNDNKSNTALLKAQAIVDAGWSKITNREYRSERINAPRFEIPDFFANN